MAEKKTLLELVVKSLEEQLEAAGITVEDLQKLQETAREIKKRKEKIEELKREIEELEEPIEPIVGVLRDAEKLRMVLVGVGLLDEETLELVSGPTHNSASTRRAGGKRTIFRGQPFNSANALVKELAKQGLIEVPNGSYSAVRLLKRWAKKNGYKVTETETELIIE